MMSLTAPVGIRPSRSVSLRNRLAGMAAYQLPEMAVLLGFIDSTAQASPSSSVVRPAWSSVIRVTWSGLVPRSRSVTAPV
jgi:hypothetical protein